MPGRESEGEEYSEEEKELINRKIPVNQNRTIYYTGEAFDEFINGYSYWSEYGIEWMKQ